MAKVITGWKSVDELFRDSERLSAEIENLDKEIVKLLAKKETQVNSPLAKVIERLLPKQK